MRALFGCLLVGVVVLISGCRENAPPRAVAVREDGVLELTLCSFNVRYEGDQDKGWKAWPNRIDRVVTALRKIKPDVFGVQEALHGQAADLRASLPDYDFHGVGRDDGKRAGEYSAIFWKRHRFEADEEDRGTFWLSDDPELPGSRSWGNTVVRVAAWVRLSDRSTGRGFYVFNTHWDHRNQHSRERAALLIAERIDGRFHRDEPVILLGDFNATLGNPAVDYFKGAKVTLAGQLVKPWNSAMVDPFHRLYSGVRNRRTLHFWEADGGSRLNHLKVDHVFVSAGAKMLDAGIYKGSSQRTQPSDHYPVWAKVAWD